MFDRLCYSFGCCVNYEQLTKKDCKYYIYSCQNNRYSIAVEGQNKLNNYLNA